MERQKAHKTVNNQLLVRGHQQAAELNPSFYKHKGSTGNSLNISLGNWKIKPARQGDPHKQVQKHNGPIPTEPENKPQNAPEASPKPPADIDYRGMTLEEYFRMSSSQTCKTEQARLKENGVDNNQLANQNDDQLFGKLEINQTDEDRYNQSHEAETPDFTYDQSKPNQNNYRKQKAADKKMKVSTKLKTEIEEQHEPNPYAYGNLNRNRLPSVLQNPTKTLRGLQQVETKRSTVQSSSERTVSNPHQDQISMRFTFNDFYKFDKDVKNERAMQKLKVQRQRAAEMRINELCLVTRYAQKFNINDAICRQIIRDSKY